MNWTVEYIRQSNKSFLANQISFESQLEFCYVSNWVINLSHGSKHKRKYKMFHKNTISQFSIKYIIANLIIIKLREKITQLFTYLYLYYFLPDASKVLLWDLCQRVYKKTRNLFSHPQNLINFFRYEFSFIHINKIKL